MTTIQKVLVELESGYLVPVDPADVYYLEAEDEDTWVRLAAAERLRVQRPLAEVATIFTPHGFLRIHRNHMINLDRVREIRRRHDRRDWEVRLDPPVNRVLPVSRERFDEPPTYRQFMQLRIYLEDLLDTKVDFVTESGLRERVRPWVEEEAIRVA